MTTRHGNVLLVHSNRSNYQQADFFKRNMAIYLFWFGTIFFLNNHFAASALKYEFIDDCQFYDRGLTLGNDNITFICGRRNYQDRVISNTESFNCSNTLFPISNLWVGTVNFQNCRFSEVKTKFLREFLYIHTFNISDLELRHLQADAFEVAINLTDLLATNNHLVEIPSLLFKHTTKIAHIDFSNNEIKLVDSQAFAGAKTVQSLNLAHNNLDHLDARVFKDTVNLIKLNVSFNKFTTFDANALPAAMIALDLAHNNLTAIKDHAFDKLIDLKQLILSFNPIGKLSVDTFAHLQNLEHLKLRHVDISAVEMGTFAQQHHLVTLDLSENQLKTLDFNLFAPVLQDLKTLELAGNRLQDLMGFRNSLVPKLQTIDISDNAFSCNYLKHFMEFVNWEKLRFAIDRNAINPREPNVRGIKCLLTNDDQFESNAINSNATYAQFQPDRMCSSAQHHYANNDLYVVKVLLVLIFVVMFTYLTAFLVMNRDGIRTQFRNVVVSYSNLRQSTANLDGAVFMEP